MNKNGMLQLLSLLLVFSTSCVTSQEKNPIDIFKPSDKAVLKKENGLEKTFASAQAALNEAKTGDTVLLSPGMHRGPLFFKSSRVTLKGEPGAFVNGNSKNWKPEWKKESEYGPRAYSSPIPFQPVTMQIDNRIMIDIKFNKGKNALKSLHQFGVGRSGRNPLRSMFTYLPSEKRVLVSFARDKDPSEHKIEAAPKGTAAISVSDFDNCIVEGLIITGGRSGVLFSNTKNSIVRKCMIYGVDMGVCLGKGAEFCKVLSNDITWCADAMNLNTSSESGLPGADVWNAHKRYGTSDKWAVNAICAGKNNEVAYNYIYDIWDGIQNENGVGKADTEEHFKNKVFKGVAEYNAGLKVHHNRIDLAIDDALEPGNELVDNMWYSNIITRAQCATRIKTATLGPFFFFDNVLMNNHDGLRFYKSTPKSATVYVYHNLIQFYYGICYHGVNLVCWNDPWLEKTLKRGVPGFHVFNNVFVCEKQLKHSKGVTPNHIAENNLYTCPPDKILAELGIDKNSIYNAKPEFVAPEKGDWRLKDGSPGKEAGKDLSKFNTKLPFCDKKYFNGKLPDMGPLGIALEKTPRGPVSGLWKIADSNIDLSERKPSEFEIEAFRWILEKDFEFAVSKNPEKERANIKLTRTPESRKEYSYLISVYGANDKLIMEKNGKASYATETISLDIPSKSEKLLKIKVKEAGAPARWKIVSDESDIKVGINAEKPLLLVKYDGGKYIFDYNVPKGTESFKIIPNKVFRGKNAVEIVDPNGTRMKLDNSGLVKTNGICGVYKIVYNFVKKGKIKVEGPSPVLFIDKKQETTLLTEKWPKPKI